MGVLAAALAAAPALAPAQETEPAAAAAATRPSITPELKGRRVERVDVTGNTTVSNAIIRNLIRTKEGEPFDPATAQEDYHRIFELRKFSDVVVRAEPTAAGGVIVVFEVSEQKLIRSIAFKGNAHVDAAALRAAADLKEGQAVDSFRIALARTAIENLYRDRNYPYAHVDTLGPPLAARGELIFDIVEGPRVRVRNIDFKGELSYSKDKLKDQIKTATWLPILRPGKYDPELLDEDVAALRRFYEGKGFFDVRVGRKVIVSPDQSEIEVDFLIEEGTHYTIDHVLFEGNASLTDAQLRANLKLVPGRFYDNEILQRDVRQVVRTYSPLGYIYDPQVQDEAYLRVEPKPVFLKAPGKVDLVYQIHEGKPFHIGRILVKGNHKSQDKLVLREFRDFAPGALFNSGQMEDAGDRLRASPFFSGVTITPIGDDPATRDVLVEVNEQKTASFNIGAGINSNGGVGGSFVFEQRNFDITNVPNDVRDVFSEHAFTGGGQEFRAAFEPGTQATNASLRFTEPYLFDQPYSFTDEFYLRDRLREHYDEHRFGDRVSLGKRFSYEWSALLSLRGEEVKITSVEEPRFRAPEILEERGRNTLTSVGLQVRRDTTNPGILPYQGSVITAGYELYGALGGDFNFQKFSLAFDGYRTLREDLLGRRTIFGLHSTAGFIPTGDSPVFERFYGGGLGSIRGFRFRGVGPRDGRGEDPVGGDFSLTGSAEVNFPVYGENLRGVVFLDAADVEPNVRFGTIRTSVGVGVRLVLPFLGQTPIAIDFGVPLIIGRNDERQLISFSFGFTP